MEFVMNPSMDGQAKACPTKRADFLRGGACFSLPSHGTCGIWLKSFSPGNPKTRGDFRSSETLLDASSLRFTGRRHECRRGTQECVRHMGQQPNVKLFLRDPLTCSGARRRRIRTILTRRVALPWVAAATLSTPGHSSRTAPLRPV